MNKIYWLTTQDWKIFQINYTIFLFKVENETRCYDELGCLNITRSWYHLIHRPLNVFPLPREVINTRFILYTQENPYEVSQFKIKNKLQGFYRLHRLQGQLLVVAKDKSIKRSNFNPKRKSKFIIHGFIDTPLSNWVKVSVSCLKYAITKYKPIIFLRYLTFISSPKWNIVD